MRYTLLIAIAVCLAGAAFAEDAGKWVSLFNGNDLAGWHEVLGGKWSVADGCIIGESGDGRYGWLVTDKMYSDFVFELDFKTEAPGNSGVQFRSHIIKEGENHDVDRMRGYQAEVSPQRGRSTGGVWDEAGDRGWLAQPPRDLDDVLREGEWNHYALVKDADLGFQRIYRNGELVAENDNAFKGIGVVNSMTFGGNQGDATTGRGWEYHGKLDDIRIYGVTLSQAEILSLVGKETLKQGVYSSADLNGDDIVDQADRDILEANMGTEQLWPLP